MKSVSELITKYSAGVPRYTSYPSVPYWKNPPTSKRWFESIHSNPNDKALSIYLHMPFCESLCTFCGCTKIITKNHNREKDYITLLKKEFSIYYEGCSELKRLPLKQIHLGGGSPTFFSAESLRDILDHLLNKLNVKKESFEGSIEVDPRRVSKDQLEVLRKFGFNRISLGVQDFDLNVQKTVNRVQPFELTQSVTNMARELGYESTNFDLIYGLPKQTMKTMHETIQKVLLLKPDRIAFYSFAYVPWLKPSQKLFLDEDLPDSNLKWQMYELARNLFVDHGYREIGIDHFALSSDGLAIAHKEKRLHRNFMGYTEQETDVLLGLGMSAISETAEYYHQNHKDLKLYAESLEKNILPTDRGHTLTAEEKLVKEQIKSLMTQFSTKISSDQAQNISKQKDFFEDELIRLSDSNLAVLDKGRPFVRNICSLLDPYFHKQERQFSQSI